MGILECDLRSVPLLIDMNRGGEDVNRCHVSPTTHVINSKDGDLNSIHSNYNNNSHSTSNGSTTPTQQTMVTSKRGRKTDREREESGGRREWSDPEISKLMQLWREHEILYDTNHPLYYVQSERKLVMDQISSDMEISVRDVNDKMHSLRTYYCSQRQRTESLEAKNGNGRALPRWKFYDQMSFLYESVTNRAAKSSLNTTKRGRKSQNRGEHQSMLDQRQPSPYSMTMTSRPDSYSPSSRDDDIRQHYQERALSYTDERYDLHNGSIHGRQRNTPIIYQPPSSPTSSEENPRKRHLSDQGYPWSDVLQYKDSSVSPPSKDPMACRTIEIQLNTADEVFGHMVAGSMAQIGDEQEKELLKLEIQKLIYNTRFKSNGNR